MSSFIPWVEFALSSNEGMLQGCGTTSNHSPVHSTACPSSLRTADPSIRSLRHSSINLNGITLGSLFNVSIAEFGDKWSRGPAMRPLTRSVLQICLRVALALGIAVVHFRVQNLHLSSLTTQFIRHMKHETQHTKSISTNLHFLHPVYSLRFWGSLFSRLFVLVDLLDDRKEFD